MIFTIWVAVGLTFASVYGLIDAIPEVTSFNPEFYETCGWHQQAMQYVYFSFITISTIGFGDLHPVHWSIKIIVMIETAVGLIIAASLAGSVIFYLTRQASIPRVSSINLTLRAGGESSCGFNLHKFDRVVDDFNFGVGFVDDGGVRRVNPPGSNHSILGQQLSITGINMDLAFNNLPLTASHVFITYEITSLAYKHRSYIRLPKKLVIEMKKQYENLKTKNQNKSYSIQIQVPQHKSLENPPKNRRWWQKNRPKVVNAVRI